MMEQEHVIVLGAGVTGLTSAVFLAETGYKVTVVGGHVPGDLSIEYTSPWAGAHWHTHATSAEPMLCDWDMQTYNFMSDLIAQERADSSLPRSGLKHNPGYQFDAKPPPSEQLWWTPHVRDFTEMSVLDPPVADINAKTPKDVEAIGYALRYTSISINAPHYLLFLRDKAEVRGVRIFKHSLPNDGGLYKALKAAEDLAKSHGRGAATAFVNATGLGASKLCNDNALYPIRGQTVLVKGEASAERSRTGDDMLAYCIPRPGAGMTILGGTREENNWSEAPDPTVTERILRQNSWQVPELLTSPSGTFEVISVQCGLRPGRKGGPRLEYEAVEGMDVVHAYGHAGAGYQNSVGSAKAVVEIVNKIFRKGKEL